MIRFVVFLMLVGINISQTDIGIGGKNCKNNVVVYGAMIIKELGYIHSDCGVSITSSKSLKYDVQLQLSFLDFNVPCDEGSVTISGYSYRDRHVVRLCGMLTSKETYKSVKGSLKIKFKEEDGVSNHSSHFKILVTEIHSGVCSNLEFECNNGNCIENGLACDDNDNCGDNSDEVKGCLLQPGAIAGIVVGSLAFLFIVFCTVVCRKKRYGSVFHVSCIDRLKAFAYWIVAADQYTEQHMQYTQQTTQYNMHPTVQPTSQCPPTALYPPLASAIRTVPVSSTVPAASNVCSTSTVPDTGRMFADSTIPTISTNHQHSTHHQHSAYRQLNIRHKPMNCLDFSRKDKESNHHIGMIPSSQPFAGCDPCSEISI